MILFRMRGEDTFFSRMLSRKEGRAKFKAYHAENSPPTERHNDFDLIRRWHDPGLARYQLPSSDFVRAISQTSPEPGTERLIPLPGNRNRFTWVRFITTIVGYNQQLVVEAAFSGTAMAGGDSAALHQYFLLLEP